MRRRSCSHPSTPQNTIRKERKLSPLESPLQRHFLFHIIDSQMHCALHLARKIEDKHTRRKMAPRHCFLKKLFRRKNEEGERRLQCCHKSAAGPLQEIRGGIPRRDHSLGVWYGVVQLCGPSVNVREGQDCGDVATPVAVIGCRPHRHQLVVKHVFVAFVY